MALYSNPLSLAAEEECLQSKIDSSGISKLDWHVLNPTKIGRNPLRASACPRIKVSLMGSNSFL